MEVAIESADLLNGLPFASQTVRIYEFGDDEERCLQFSQIRSRHARTILVYSVPIVYNTHIHNVYLLYIIHICIRGAGMRRDVSNVELVTVES